MLTRRQVYDFGHAREALAFWQRLPEGKKLWLWNNDNRWWGYVTLILLAHLQAGDPTEASQFAQSLLDDPATPRTALPGLLVPYYVALIRCGRAGEALKAFEWIVTENPTQSGCAPAYYWLALNAQRRGDKPSTTRWSESLLLGNTHTEITSDQWLLEAKARLLMNGLDPKKVSSQAVNFNNPYLGTALDEIQNDLRLL